jgi:hypothetical protein
MKINLIQSNKLNGKIDKHQDINYNNNVNIIMMNKIMDKMINMKEKINLKMIKIKVKIKKMKNMKKISIKITIKEDWF